MDVDSSTRLKSVTQERDLDEFLNTAQLAGTEFTAGMRSAIFLGGLLIRVERRNVKIIQQTASLLRNPHLLSEQEEEKVLHEQQQNKQRLRVPRRPPWKKSMTLGELDRQEKASFLEWRRGLAE